MDDIVTPMHLTREILREALQLGQRADKLVEESPLLGAIPELDSMAVVTVLTLIEENLNVTIADDDVSAEEFQTVGALAAFVARLMSCGVRLER